MTIRLENSMTIFWKKVWEKIRKYWQIVVGLVVGLSFALKLWWRLRAQKKVLQKEIEVAKKVRQVEADFVDAVKNVEESSQKKHEEKVSEIMVEDKKEKDKIKKDLEDRIEENNNGSNEDLANKIGSSFGVDVIAPEDSDE